ncbi:MAG: M48 family metalloprotease [Balneolales bacterium]
MLIRLQKTFTAGLCALLIVGFYACVVQENPISGSQRAFGYSWDQEVELGRQSDEDITAYYGLYDDDEMAAYVTRVGEEVLRQSHMRREDTPEQFRETEFYFRVLDSPVINAFALPGGYVYVTRGLMAHLNNEAQLAVVLGHEIGHVAGRHASQRAFNQQIGQIALIGGAIAGQELLGIPGQEILGLGGTAAQLLFLRHSRDHERESDKVGVEYAAKSGYRAHEGSEFFRTLKRLGERQEGTLPNFLSTHPDPGDRERAIIDMAEDWAEAGENLETIDRDQYFSVVDGIIFGNNPRDGFVENGVFYHPNNRFRFQIPENWEQQHEGNQMVLIEQNQEAIMIFQAIQDLQSAEEAVDQFGMQEGVEVTQKQSVRANGLPAWMLRAQGQTEDGELEFMVFGIEYNNAVYRFVNYSTASDFSQYEQIFTSTITSFQELTDQSRLNVNPVRLETTVVNRSGSFESFLPSSLPMDIDPLEIAIVNQVDPDTQISSGTRLKLPVQ